MMPCILGDTSNVTPQEQSHRLAFILHTGHHLHNAQHVEASQLKKAGYVLYMVKRSQLVIKYGTKKYIVYGKS